MIGFELIAQLGLALAGFTGIYLALSHDRLETSVLDEIGVRLIVVNSFFATFLSLVPIILAAGSMEPANIWRISSAAYVIAAVAVFLHLENRLRVVPRDQKPQHMSVQNFLGRYTTIALILAQLPNLAAWPFEPSPFIFLLGITVALGLGAMTFAGFLFSRLR